MLYNKIVNWFNHYIKVIKALTIKIYVKLNGKKLQNIDATTPEEQHVLQAFTKQVNESDATLDGDEIGMWLSGLQNTDATSKTVRNLLQVLIKKINQSDTAHKLHDSYAKKCHD